jgi:ATP-dependent helicase/nuclease subunit A
VQDAGLVTLARLRREPALQAASWFDLLQNAECLPAELQGLGAVLVQYQGWVNALPPHDALDAIYHHGDVLARFAAAAPPAQRDRVLANLRALLSAALQVDGGRYLTPYTLVRAFRKGHIRAPSRADARAVRLLTIHGAKGLEARAVLMLDADAAPARADTMGVLVDWPGEATAPRKFVFLASESSPPPCAQATLLAEQVERRREELNALYVAMTRAREQLVISSIEPYQATGDSWWQRLQPLARQAVLPDDPAGRQMALQIQAGGPVGAEFFLPVLPELPLTRTAVSATTLVPSGGSQESEASSLSSRMGQAMHWLLEHAVPGTGAAVDDPVDSTVALWLAHAAREFNISLDEARQAAIVAQRIRAGEGAWAWDPAVIDWQGNEVDLLHRGERLRIDRLVRRIHPQPLAGWWVLDYKSAAEPERQAGLLAQMRRYCAAVQAASPGEVVRAAFLSGDGRMVVTDGDNLV